jgi:hypothetical protein
LITKTGTAPTFRKCRATPIGIHNKNTFAQLDNKIAESWWYGVLLGDSTVADGR